MLPVYNIMISYHKPLVFGDSVKVQICCSKPYGVWISLDYKLFNMADEIVLSAKVIPSQKVCKIIKPIYFLPTAAEFKTS